MAKKRYFDVYVLVAFFLIGTGVCLPIGVMMLIWKAWNEYKGQFWKEKINMNEYSQEQLEDSK